MQILSKGYHRCKTKKTPLSNKDKSYWFLVYSIFSCSYRIKRSTLKFLNCLSVKIKKTITDMGCSPIHWNFIELRQILYQNACILGAL